MVEGPCLSIGFMEPYGSFSLVAVHGMGFPRRSESLLGSPRAPWDTLGAPTRQKQFDETVLPFSLALKPMRNCHTRLGLWGLVSLYTLSHSLKTLCLVKPYT